MERKGGEMELKELTKKTLELFEINSIEELKDKLFIVCKNNKHDKLKNFKELVGDLSVDWMQKIFQYYEADRKEKKQDYTPKCLADFCGKLAGNADVVVDMCAGSGALTIQKWGLDKTQKFELYEFDENVIPYLLFNMMLRNINCYVYHSDVLQGEVFHEYRIKTGEEFGIVEVVR